ncbi:flavodoxin domain-containing protein [Pseudoalteromonas sp. MMG010]|uniref:flavodoxin domain-containing protein n=1 Tax=Pseudoalteromonas sp. MMG010 TaxID=2822685 RepID=UPI001B3A0F3A|nr:flavodoxin domain-containing protein [Pseudoalteromonas sp. MMG010]MBQ4831648.1 flavodoxin domain-containing protein [Pseudoalteromonas sp. MMG010]
MAHISIFVGSVNGGAERLSVDIAKQLDQAGHESTVIMDASVDDIKNAKNILVITSTTGQGDIPSNLAGLYFALNSTFPMLTDKPFGIIAMGDRCYGDTFCGAGRSFDELLRDLQAKPVGSRLEIDASVDYDPLPVAQPWLNSWLNKLQA